MMYQQLTVRKRRIQTDEVNSMMCFSRFWLYFDVSAYEVQTGSLLQKKFKNQFVIFSFFNHPTQFRTCLFRVLIVENEFVSFSIIGSLLNYLVEYCSVHRRSTWADSRCIVQHVFHTFLSSPTLPLSISLSLPPYLPPSLPQPS